MNICYLDESGTPEVPGTSSHFVLVGVSIPIARWRDADREISTILARYGLADAELHTAWLLRRYVEQDKISGFQKLDYALRRSAVARERAAHLLELQRTRQLAAYRQTKKNYAGTLAYTHLTLDERRRLVEEIAQCVAQWTFAKLFAECIDKLHFDPVRTNCTIEEQAFEQVVSRFEQYLVNTGGAQVCGILVHDNNDTVARKHMRMMRSFHEKGTLWTNITRISETPLFVNSELTRMVQIADLCGYALRRCVENGETQLFQPIFTRADRARGIVLGVRHFTKYACSCPICLAHRH